MNLSRGHIRGPLLLSALLFSLLGALFVQSTALADEPVQGAVTEPAWRAVYWNNTSMSGQPTHQQDESNLDYDWGLGSPGHGVNSDNFSARWQRVVELPAGLYRISATSDDGVRVFVNDEQVLNGWWAHGVRTFTTERRLNAGNHELRVEYFERSGAARIKFSLERIGDTPSGPTPTPTPAPGGKPPISQPADESWRGEYYGNENLSGSPSLVRQDTSINFGWGTSAPDPNLPADHFSVRWSRNLFFEAGMWRFTTQSDDGVRLWIDGELVIDQWRLMAGESHHARVALQGGVHSVRLEYFERTGMATAMLKIEKEGLPEGKGNLVTCVPPNPPNYAWIRVYRKDPGSGEWYRAIPRGVGSIHASGYLKIDGLPVDLVRYGGAGEPYWIEQWIDGKVARSVGNTSRGEAEFRIRAGADNFTPWQC